MLTHPHTQRYPRDVPRPSEQPGEQWQLLSLHCGYLLPLGWHQSSRFQADFSRINNHYGASFHLRIFLASSSMNFRQGCHENWGKEGKNISMATACSPVGKTRGWHLEHRLTLLSPFFYQTAVFLLTSHLWGHPLRAQTSSSWCKHSPDFISFIAVSSVLNYQSRPSF